MRTPALSAASRRPAASLPGSRMPAPVWSQRPPRNVGEWTSACIAAASRTVTSCPNARSGLRVLEPGELVLVGEREQLAGGLEVAVDPVGGEVLQDAVEVLEREPFEGRHLVGEAREAVLDPVREAGHGEPAVAAAGAEPGGLGLEHDDIAALLGRVQRRPQAGEARADDAQVGARVLGQRGGRVARFPQPERARLGFAIARAVLRRGGAGRPGHQLRRARASRSRSSSPRWRPTSCRPIGRSSGVRPAGTDSAGCAVTVIRLHERNHSM